MTHEAAPEHRVRLISQGFNSWKMQVLFSQRQMSAAEISEQLSIVKAGLAFQFGIPNDLLEYGGLLDKRSTRNGLLVTMQIRKRQVAAGAPRFRGLNLTAPDGTVFHNMVLEADLFPYDEFDKPLSVATIESRLVAEHYDLTCVNWEKVTELISQLEQTGNPILGVEIGRGTLPGTGSSSQITYGLPGLGGEAMSSLWIGGFPVEDGDFLASVTPAIGGHETGKNIFGRELSPRAGIETALEAGDGTRLCMNGRTVKATRDGLVVYERIGRDRRDRDGSDLIPTRLRVRVLPILNFTEPQRFDLDLYDAAVIRADLLEGSRIRSQEPIYIDGHVPANCVIESASAIRIVGNVNQSVLKSEKHICVIGNLNECHVEATLSLQILGRAVDSTLRGIEVVAAETVGGVVDAVKRSDITHILKAGHTLTDVRVDTRRFLEMQQSAGLEAVVDLKEVLTKIVRAFGPAIVAEAGDGSVQRALIRWLRSQKSVSGRNFTHHDVQEFRALLEMVPQIRTQLTAIGLELQDVSSKLMQDETNASTDH